LRAHVGGGKSHAENKQGDELLQIGLPFLQAVSTSTSRKRMPLQP
jgi:hypothetical protein